MVVIANPSPLFFNAFRRNMRGAWSVEMLSYLTTGLLMAVLGLSAIAIMRDTPITRTVAILFGGLFVLTGLAFVIADTLFGV